MVFHDQARAVDLLYEWTPEKMVEVLLDKPDDFLKVRETLTRMGIASKRPDLDGRQVLTQSCHLLHKKGKYYIMHFKELFCLDGRDSDLTVSDVERRNLIISLLQEWELIKVVNAQLISFKAPMSSIRVISHKEKNGWKLTSKYTVGIKK
jgi:hypothetical protein